MPEFKRTFTGGRMEKDLDERMVSNGLYREALNIEVATSEGSDVGAAENILGNVQTSEAINGPDNKYVEVDGGNRHIAFVVDQETGMLYRFINTECNAAGVWMDRIIEYDTTKSIKDSWDEKEAPVLIDIYKVRTFCTDSGEDPCLRPWIKVYDNYAQLRPFMALVLEDAFGELHEDAYIESIAYGNDGGGDFAILTLNKKVPDRGEEPCGEELIFVADRILNFHPDRKITGINIMDGMIFWTDNYSEPKKISIKRSKLGCQYLLGPDASSFVYKYRHFDQHTRLIINVDKATGLGENPIECLKSDIICPVYGCTDPTAINFDPNATVDDGSCIATVYGCMDNTAFNYNPLANTNDPNDPCCYVSGCTDPLYCEYDPLACFDDGSCEELAGCTDPLATNYDSSASCDDGSCVYLWNCSGAGYGNEGCVDVNREIVFLSGSSYSSTFYTHKAFESVAAGSTVGLTTVQAHEDYAKMLWWEQSIPAITYSSNPLDSNYYGTTGDCIYPGPSGTWIKKFRFDRLIIGNFLPTSPNNFTINNTLGNLFNETLHLGECTGNGINTEPDDKFLEYFYDNIVIGSSTLSWIGCNWSYGGQAPSHHTNNGTWNGLCPSFLELLQTRGFGDNINDEFKSVYVAVLSDIGDSASSWEIQEGKAKLTLVRSSGFEWGAPTAVTQHVQLTGVYDLYDDLGNVHTHDRIENGWLAPKIDETWAWEDILRVMQADWGQLSNFSVENEAGETFTFQKNNEGSPITFNVEMIPTACSCTSWQSCICEKDPVNGVYTSLYDCEHDGMNYNTCCSQVNAPAQAIPTVAPPLVIITPSPPPTPPPPAPAPPEEGESY